VDLNSAGALLYWCEGSKRERDRRVEFVNSDFRMISIFMRYIRAKKIDEGRLKVRMMIHQQDNEVECRAYWKSVTQLADSNFIAPSVKRTSPVRNPLPYGTVAIRYNSVELLRQINKDILKIITKLS
jgi:hypothetical protein